MIHDAKVEVTCDGARCDEFVFADLHAVIGILFIKMRIENEIVKLHDWIVLDGKHYCSEHCYESGD